jgi:hypothetical protein
MPFTLQCGCGVRLEVDDVFAGKSVNCPDCNQPLKVPRSHSAGFPVSMLALSSFLVALVGAFTILGSLAAVGLGIWAMISLRGKGDRLGGRGFALAGILLGLIFTGLTYWLLASPDLRGLQRFLIEREWAGRLDFSKEDIVRVGENYLITRRKDWGALGESAATAATPVQVTSDEPLVLVAPSLDAQLICIFKPVDTKYDLSRCADDALREFKVEDRGGFFGRPGLKRPSLLFKELKRSERPLDDTQTERIELEIRKVQWRQDRTFLMHVVKNRGDNAYYVIIAGTRTQNFEALRDELKSAIEGFRVLELKADPGRP